MSDYGLSVHVDRADPSLLGHRADLLGVKDQKWLRVPLIGADWSGALREVSLRTANPYPHVLVGLSKPARKNASETQSAVYEFRAPAHRSDAAGRLIQVAHEPHRLYDDNGKALPDIISRYVPAEVVQVAPQSQRGDDHIHFTLDKRQFERGFLFVQQAIANPGFYNIQSRNCAGFARDLMRAVGVTLPIPEDVPAGIKRLQRAEHFSHVVEVIATRGISIPNGSVKFATPELIG